MTTTRPRSKPLGRSFKSHSYPWHPAVPLEVLFLFSKLRPSAPEMAVQLDASRLGEARASPEFPPESSPLLVTVVCPASLQALVI